MLHISYIEYLFIFELINDSLVQDFLPLLLKKRLFRGIKKLYSVIIQLLPTDKELEQLFIRSFGGNVDFLTHILDLIYGIIENLNSLDYEGNSVEHYWLYQLNYTEEEDIFCEGENIQPLAKKKVEIYIYLYLDTIPGN